MRILDWRWWLGIRPQFATEPPKDYSISVVVPAYNEEKSIGNTVESIKKQTVAIARILVVDDSSQDATGDVARSHGAEVIRTVTNQGTKAMAQNYVLPMVDTELMVTIDADTILAPDAVEKTLPYFGDEKTASVCGFVIPQKVRTMWERGRFIEYLFGISVCKAGQNNFGAVLVSSGCFSVFRTEVLKSFGGFKARTMAEDMDFTWEAQYNGYHVYCVQDAFCFPIDPSTASVFISQVDRWCRSFFQNIAIHRFRMNKKLAIIIYGELLNSFASQIIFVIFLCLAKNLFSALALGIVVDFLLIGIPCVIKGARIGMLRATVLSLPFYFVVRLINQYIFWRSLWKEWIIRERLSTWNKGH